MSHRPKETSASPTLDANYRHSGTQSVLQRTPLLIDGLLNGSFNNLKWQVWIPSSSKLQPSRKSEIYLLRVSLIVTASSSSVITIDLDVGGTLIYRNSFQPMELVDSLNVLVFPVFAGANFLEKGGILNVSATSQVQLKNSGLYIVRLSPAAI